MIRIWKIKDVVALADFILHVHVNTSMFMRSCTSLARKDVINLNVNKPEKKRKETNYTC